MHSKIILITESIYHTVYFYNKQCDFIYSSPILSDPFYDNLLCYHMIHFYKVCYAYI